MKDYKLFKKGREIEIYFSFYIVLCYTNTRIVGVFDV